MIREMAVFVAIVASIRKIQLTDRFIESIDWASVR